VENAELINDLVQEDKWITATDIADMLDISCEYAYSFFHADLKYHKICARWLPKQFTDQHKWAHVEAFMQFVQ
jgi:hypothetical protein